MSSTMTTTSPLSKKRLRTQQQQQQQKKDLPKLPWPQLLILAVCRLADPITLSSVFPYLPEMIESFRVPAAEVSTWAGITLAVFSLSQAVTGVLWGRASDRFGRKPVILCGMLCIMTASVCFGFSRDLAWAVVARSLMGASDGNMGIMRTAVAEMVREKALQPTAFAVMPVVWQVGCTLGPVIGGLLANPARNFPGVFGRNEFLKRFPFALPNLVAAGFLCVGMTAGFLFLKETLDAKKHRRDLGLALGDLILSSCRRRRRKGNRLAALDDEQSAPLLKDSPETPTRPDHPSPAVEVKKKKSTYREIFTPQSNINLLVYTILALHSIAYDQLLPVFMHYPPQHHRSSDPRVHLPFKFTGGFGINSGQIGLFFMAIALIGMLVQFLAFPYFCNRYGVLRSFKVIACIFPLAYVVTPFTALLPSLRAQEVGIFAVMIAKWWASIFAFPCSTILLTNSASSLGILGTLNGVAVSISALGRAAGPFVAGWAFTKGVETGYGILPWWILAGVSVGGAVPVWWLREGEGFASGGAGGGDEEDEGEEEGTEVEIGRRGLTDTDGGEQGENVDIDVDMPPPYRGRGR